VFAVGYGEMGAGNAVGNSHLMMSDLIQLM